MALTAVLFLADALILRLELSAVVVGPGRDAAVVAFRSADYRGCFQVDSPASLTEDWLCRPRVAGRQGRSGAGDDLPATPSAPCSTMWFSVQPVFRNTVDSLLLPDELFLAFMPVLMFIAIITRTFIQAFGVLFAIFVCVSPDAVLAPTAGSTEVSARRLWLASGCH